MSKSIIILYTGQLDWKMASTDSSIMKLKSIPNLTFLNPLHYRDLYMQEKLIQLFSIAVNGDYMISTSGFILSGEAATLKSFHENHEFVSDSLQNFLEAIRYSSKQAKIDPTYSEGHFFKEFPKTKINRKPSLIHYTYGRSRFDIPITIKDLKFADQLIAKGNEIPIYDEIMLDALSSLIRNEYKKCIVFSAAAMESVVKWKLESHYHKMLSKNSQKQFRITIDEGQISDPIYQFLKKSRFGNLLHEGSLYLFRKSLRIDNDTLYHKALRVYQMRNKIIHNDNIPHSLNTKNVSSTACESYKTAIELFEWFGERGYNKTINNTIALRPSE